MNNRNQYDPYVREDEPNQPYPNDRYRNETGTQSYGQATASSNSDGYEQPAAYGYTRDSYESNYHQSYGYEQGYEASNDSSPYGYQAFHTSEHETSQPQMGYDRQYQGAYVNAQGKPPEEEKKKKHRFLFWLIFLIAFCVFLYSAFQLFIILKQNWDEKRELENITEIANIPEDPETPFTIDWEELRKVNDHITGWILIPDTNISYPIVQGENNDYYLDHTFAKESNYAGAIFVEYRNKPDFSDNNTFVYGHNVKHGTMFAELEKFMDQGFFDSHKYVYLFTPNQNYKCEVLSFYSTKDGSDSYQFGISDVTVWKKYIETITAPNLAGHVRNDVTMGESDRMISLSTCSYEINNAPSDQRYLLHAKLVPWIGQLTQDQAEINE